MENSFEIDILAAKARMNVLDEMRTAHAGHIGGSMSMMEVLAVLYGRVMNVDINNPKWEKRDRLVVSKGHCGPAVYAMLAEKGFFPKDWLPTLNQPGTRLPSHCDKNKVLGVDMTTGSLGQGMSTSLGLAWGLQYQNIDAYTYLILGDGECDEGQVWEGALFASTKRLNKFIGFIDKNDKQLDGYTKDICDVGDLATKFKEFGWYSLDVNGHDVNEIYEAIKKAKKQTKPTMIVLHTIKGKDCTFAENLLYNHHLTFNEEQYMEAYKFLEDKVISLGREKANV